MYDVIIIGAGPAGLTAGLYAGRFKLNTLIFEKQVIGGQIILSSLIENYPGFPGGIAPGDLIERFKKQVQDLDIKIEHKEVMEIKPGPDFVLKTQEEEFTTKSIIIATGAKAKPLNINGEKRFFGRGVSYCATCDGPLFKDKDVAVIGGGDRAIEEAIFLSSYAKKVYLIHRRQEFRAAKILIEKARQNPKINFILDSTAEEIRGQNKVEEVLIKNIKSNSQQAVLCQGVFIFVGIEPHTDFLKNILRLDEQGFIITDDKLQTSSEGIFACGDCRKKSLYQVISACGEGAVAADSAHRYLL